MTIDVWTHSRIIRERMRQPIEVDGAIYHPTTTAADLLGVHPNTLRVAAQYTPGDNVVLTAANGLRFVRVPRHRGDTRPPLYWNLEAQS